MPVLALDIGRVCVRLCYERMLGYFGLEGEAHFNDAWLVPVGRYSKGLIGDDEFARAIGELTGGHLSREEIKHGWNLMIGDEIQETTDMLHVLLKHGWSIHFLSDIQPWHMERVLSILSYSDVINDGILSYEVGAEKPSALMCEAFERRYGRPDLYVDDIAGNIEAARSRGWNAVQYMEAEHTAKSILDRLGYL